MCKRGELKVESTGGHNGLLWKDDFQQGLLVWRAGDKREGGGLWERDRTFYVI